MEGTAARRFVQAWRRQVLLGMGMIEFLYRT